MKINEFMIGDWVYVVKRISVLENDFTDFIPIPITMYILEKSGFKIKYDFCGTGNVDGQYCTACCSYVREDMNYSIDVRLGGIKSYITVIIDGERMLSNFPVSYVHEMQHLMRAE